MDYNETQEQLKAVMTTLKLTEKKHEELGFALSKWKKRVELARNSGQTDLQSSAEAECAQLMAQEQSLADEIAEYKEQIVKLRAELPRRAAQQRTVDTDILAQELLMAAGYNPGEEAKVAADQAWAETEKQTAIENALASLKEKMKSSGSV
jgi:phage shock protein A